MNYIKQIFYEMRHQKMMTWVSIGGTALAIFLVMAFFMSEQIDTVEVQPVSKRSRILYGTGMHLRSTNPSDHNDGSAGLSMEAAKKIYEGLDGIEEMTCTYWNPEAESIGLPNEETFSVSSQATNASYWKIFDFTFLYGKPYDKAAVDAGERVVVLTRNIARKIFKEDDVVGREVLINYIPYTVCGVVEDVPQMFQGADNDIFVPINVNKSFSYGEGAMDGCGQLQTVMLMKPGVTRDDIAAQVKARYATMTESLKDEQFEAVYHEQPYTPATIAEGGFGSNNSPDTSGDVVDWFIYAILILLPAINLSSMTRGRLRHRVSEIGVRRAFGAKRTSIIRQMMIENLIITIIGGLIGLVCSFLFMWLVSDFFFDFGAGQMSGSTGAKPTFEMLFSWKSFAVAVVLCFVLNLVSAFVPSWSASRVDPAIAINKVR